MSETVFWNPKQFRTARLIVFHLEDTPVEHVLKAVHSVGRAAPGNSPDIPLASPTASRHHGQFSVVGDHCYYHDLSRNGTWINGIQQKNPNQFYEVMDGDVFFFCPSANSGIKREEVVLFSSGDTVPRQWNKIQLSDDIAQIKIGRNSGNLKLADAAVSENHAVFFRASGGWSILDCGSTNGVSLNQQKIKGSSYLSPMDVVRIADTWFVFTGTVIWVSIQPEAAAQAQEYPPQQQEYPPRPGYQPPQQEYPPRPGYQPPQQEYPQRSDYQPPQQEYPPRPGYQPPRQEYPPKPDYQPPQQEYPPRPGYQPPQQEYPPLPGYQPPQQEYPPKPDYQPPQQEYPPQTSYQPPQQEYPPRPGYQPPQQEYPPQTSYQPPQQEYPPRPGYQPPQNVYPPQPGADISGGNGSYGVMPVSSCLAISIEERNVWQRFKKKTLLKDINLTVHDGELVLILGGSGAGKTTFMNAVMGYEKADGMIAYGDKDIYEEYEQMKYEIGYVPQKDLLRDTDTVIDTLWNAAKMRMPSTATMQERSDRVEEVLLLMGLQPERDSMVSKLSGGQKKRLSIAGEFMSDPRLFFLDEPDSGLDGQMARELMRNLRQIADKGKIVMVISHSPDRVPELFDKVVVLAKSPTDGSGHLAFFGSVEEAYAFFGTASLEEVVKRINRPDEGGDGLADYYIEQFQARSRG